VAGHPSLGKRGYTTAPMERRHQPWTLKSLSAAFHTNALKYTYDYSCFLARLDENRHLMAEPPTPRRHRELLVVAEWRQTCPDPDSVAAAIK
jgi:hypothetical protein